MNLVPSTRVERLQARYERTLRVARYNGGVLRKVDWSQVWCGRPSDKRRVPDGDVRALVKRGWFVLTEERDGTPKVALSASAPLLPSR
jgi:hypothetical protein